MVFLFRAVVTAVAVWIVTLLNLASVSGGNETWWGRALVYLGVGAVLVAVNMVVKPIVNLVTLPIRILTLGLFALIINWAMLELTAWITTLLPFGDLTLGGFWRTLLAAFLIAIITVILGGSRKKSKKHD